MRETTKGLRFQIGIFGRRNVGKSSLLNALVRQTVSIVSADAGTTTDPVEKPFELLPVGPTLFIDTAGIDDVGALGSLRVGRTNQIFERCHVGVLVAEPGIWTEYEEEILRRLRQSDAGRIVVFNKCDLGPPNTELASRLEAEGAITLKASAIQGLGLLELRSALIRVAPDDFINAKGLVADLVGPGELAVLVVPIDLEAPKGRLILPQVQTIRELLDGDSYCMIVKERELRAALDRLKTPPALVVTDSQAFLKVAADTPESVPMTSFSVLFSRLKGDLFAFVQGATAIDSLRTGSRVLIAEACSHHPIGDDIGRVKIPRWLTQYVGGKLELDHVQGHDFPSDLADYQLVVHCGGCMHGRREMLGRIESCRSQGVPITNYGLTIAYSLGVFERALRPFPAAYEWYEQQTRERDKSWHVRSNEG